MNAAPFLAEVGGLDAVARESERALREMIRRWQALPPGRRTNFLRTRISGRGTAL